MNINYDSYMPTARDIRDKEVCHEQTRTDKGTRIVHVNKWTCVVACEGHYEGIKRLIQ